MQCIMLLFNSIISQGGAPGVEHAMSVQSQTCQCSHIHVSAVTFKFNSNYIESIAIMYLLFISDYAIKKY